jgi:hypothetical protein
MITTIHQSLKHSHFAYDTFLKSSLLNSYEKPLLYKSLRYALIGAFESPSIVEIMKISNSMSDSAIANELFERISFSNEAIATIIDLLHFDKKNTFGEIQFVLLEKIGKATINKNADKTLIYKAFEEYKC